MDWIGKPTINPVLFYTGKLSGYATWIILFLALLDIMIFEYRTYIYNQILAYVFCLSGLAFAILSMVNLGKSTRLGLPDEKTTLKTTGLYRFSRNPMYVGFNLLTLSSVTYTVNILVAIAGIYSIVIYHLIILGEEKFLRERFGTAYNNYVKKVSRYL
jgi:protein-S-isoprenylcysteine O-methyltransferase Ste14